MILVLPLIGRGSGAGFFNQSQSVAIRIKITFDAQLKSALKLKAIVSVINNVSSRIERQARSNYGMVKKPRILIC